MAVVPVTTIPHALAVMEDVAEEQRGHVVAGAGAAAGTLQNATRAWCRVCGCLILDARTARLVRRPVELPPSRSERGISPPPASVPVSLFWHLPDMYAFMNIGFTHNAARALGAAAATSAAAAAEPERARRFLTCADCEKEVLGFQYLDEPKHFYLAFDRVAYVKPTA